MSEKRKPQVIKVGKLIVKADEVIVVNERKRRLDPWGFPVRDTEKVDDVKFLEDLEDDDDFKKEY
ncbi:hypothetical protein EJF36_06355 [Bacillus sp. HMF5848]|uniref:hypothetical protein n=1 Tax=Bacillus sp. HMF5848 TaxID=2495421 RepID=UPI000F7789EB|nr:hypothetical protein [Bacillus sp. HMF5848]RSK26511.1 hypothetical protein EJF36_06355 [Bacillus sp. HMF5848]